MTEPAFKPGDRCFSHYTRNTARGVSGWGTVERLDTTYRGQTHGVTGSPLPDTTWYDIRTDEGSTELLDDAHGDWDMARIVAPHIAERYGYGADPARYIVKPHTARMTGAFWWIVVEREGDGQVSLHMDDLGDAIAEANRLNATVVPDAT